MASSRTSPASRASTLVAIYLFWLAAATWLRGWRTAIGSPWRIPMSWIRFGRVPHGAAFGVALGFGLVVSIPSLGFVGLIGWILTGPSITAVLLSMTMFALARQLPLVVIAAAARVRELSVSALVQSSVGVVGRTDAVEALLILTLALTMFSAVW